MSTDFGYYYADHLLTLDLKPREWLIENLIRAKDSVILVGNEKSGKSLFIFQLVHSLTSGRPFLDNYRVTKPCRVVYIQLEGELNDSQDRIKRMSKTHEIDGKNFLIYFSPPMNMQENEFRIGLQNELAKQLNSIKPDVVIIDPIYFAFTGSLSDDEAVRKFIGNIRVFKEVLNCAVILVHHTHKTRFSITDGTIIDEGDEAIFGSKFLKAWADHILLFIYDSKRNLRTLSCNTQRSGDIMKKCVLNLIEPDPLYFEMTEDKTLTKDMNIVNLLQREEYRHGLTHQEIADKIGISNTVFFKTIKMLQGRNMIIRIGTKPVIYKYNYDGLADEKVQEMPEGISAKETA